MFDIMTRTGNRALTAGILALALAGTSATALFGQQEPPMEPPADWGPISSTLEEVEYPNPVHFLDLRIFGQDVQLAYQDVAPTGTPNGQAVMLFHGMNFAGYASGGTIEDLAAAGFRVIVPDRIGYGRSSKPDIPYNFNMVVSNARALLDHLGIEEAAIVGHSMGGMVASRFALIYPDVTTHVVMVNQIGLSDQRLSRPWRDMEDAYQGALNSSYQGILRNHMSYYPTWDNEYLEWVRIQYGMTLTSEWPRLARIRAWQQQMLYFDPVVYDWQHIDTKALVIGGAQDGLTPRWEELARGVAESLQNAELILYPGIGHNPQFEIREQFHGDLINFLLSDPNEPANTEWQDD
jgi:pimeloyl-ACP methyl ester carboxylesterase